MGDKLLQAALIYAKDFDWAVFPLCPKTKVPHRDTGGVSEATKAPETIREGWQKWPGSNIGLAAGKSGLVVVDLDVKRGNNGIEAWRDLEMELGFETDTVTSLTPSGGQHLFFVAPEGVYIKPTANQLGPGIDIRAGNSYVLLPPSMNGDGKLYRWEISSRPGECAIMPLPRPILDLLTKEAAQPVPPLPEVIPVGERNKMLMSLAGSMRRRNANRAAILAALREQNKACAEPLPDKELKSIAKKAARYSPQPVQKAAPPVVELLEVAPKMITRPLSLIDGVAYAAFWPWVQVTMSESLNKSGEVVKHNPALVTTKQRLVIVRGDGAWFSEIETPGMSTFEDLGVLVRLPEIPKQDRLWSKAGVERFREGYRPEPLDVFNRVADIPDRFMSFDYSLSDQRTMSELTACYILATYFTSAFQVIGYLWPNGDFGSGKTKHLVVTSELSYLGTFILAGSTYATLRDLADYGATLAFDDAESIMDRRQIDPDKRTLLLAGNRRGATIAVKEPAGPREWRTRYVNTFCPRLFSAIHLPDPVLSSRTIVIPLLRTLDRGRANADPLDYTLWPHDRQALIDDLWALALTHLPELAEVDLKVAEKAKLMGRALEPWRAILAVALWLGEELFNKMNALSEAYQAERFDLESTDLSALCAEGIMEIGAKSERWDDGNLKFSARDLAEEMTRLAKENDRHSGGELYATPQRIGVTLSKMRISKGREKDTGRARYRFLDYNMLQRLANTYRLTCPDCPNMSTCPPEDPPPGHVDNPGHAGHVGVEVDDPLIQAAQDLGGVVADVIPLDDGTAIPF